mgnify:CR=1 FL=1
MINRLYALIKSWGWAGAFKGRVKHCRDQQDNWYHDGTEHISIEQHIIGNVAIPINTVI